MYLPNDVARCSDALDLNCQWRHNCKRWGYRAVGRADPFYRVVWHSFAKDIQPNKKCEHQLRID